MVERECEGEGALRSEPRESRQTRTKPVVVCSHPRAVPTRQREKERAASKELDTRGQHLAMEKPPVADDRKRKAEEEHLPTSGVSLSPHPFTITVELVIS